MARTTAPPPATCRIGISLGAIGSLTDGLGEFATQICEHIATAAPRWRAHGVSFELHLPRRWHGRFGSDVGYLATHKLQGHWHWQRGPRFAVWHALNQLGRIGPPAGTARSLLTLHDMNTLYADADGQHARAMAKLRARLRRVDELTTLTNHVAADIRRHLDWRGPLTVIANGARDLTTQPRRAVSDLPPGRFLLHLSRLAPSKNPASLIGLAAVWPEQLVVLAGPPSNDAAQLVTEAQRHGLHNVRVLQGVDDEQKAWLYANCAAFLFPSLTEGFGLPPLEAMHFGKPVFLSDRTSLPEVGGNWAGYFHDFDPLAMRRCIEAESPRLLTNAAAIRAHAAGFSWDAAAQRYLAIYRRLLPAPLGEALA